MIFCSIKMIMRRTVLDELYCCGFSRAEDIPAPLLRATYMVIQLAKASSWTAVSEASSSLQVWYLHMRCRGPCPPCAMTCSEHQFGRKGPVYTT